MRDFRPRQQVRTLLTPTGWADPPQNQHQDDSHDESADASNKDEDPAVVRRFGFCRINQNELEMASN